MEWCGSLRCYKLKHVTLLCLPRIATQSLVVGGRPLVFRRRAVPRSLLLQCLQAPSAKPTHCTRTQHSEKCPVGIHCNAMSGDRIELLKSSADSSYLQSTEDRAVRSLMENRPVIMTIMRQINRDTNCGRRWDSKKHVSRLGNTYYAAVT